MAGEVAAGGEPTPQRVATDAAGGAAETAEVLHVVRHPAVVEVASHGDSVTQMVALFNNIVI